MGKRLTATREFFAFYRAEFIPTTIAEWGRAMALGTSLAALFSLVYYLFKRYITEAGQEATIMNLWWQFALIFFVCLVIARLILAPYRKYRQLEKQFSLRMKLRRDKWRQIVNVLREKHRAEECKLKEQWGTEVSAIKAERDALQLELKELKQPSLVLEVDTNEQSQVMLSHFNRQRGFEYAELWRIRPDLKIRFINNNIHRVTVLVLSASLVKVDEDGETEIPLEAHKLKVYNHPDMSECDFNALPVDGGDITQYYWFMFQLEVSTEYMERIDSNYFLRVTMGATRLC